MRVLLHDDQVRISASAQEFFVENVVRVQTPQGLQAMGTLQLLWKPDTDVLTVHKLHLLRGDQVIDLLANDANKFTLLRRENNLEYSSLDGILTAVLQPSDLRVGDVIDMAYTVKRSDPVLGGTAEARLGGWIQLPFARVHLRALWPRSMPVRWRATDEISPHEQRVGDYSELTYEHDGLTPPVQPTGAPRRFAVTRELELSSFTSWSDISKRLAPLYSRAAVISKDSPLQQEIARIKALSSDPTVRAAAALALVEDAVRYVYLGMNQGGLVPAGADLTWSRRYGDCKAKSALLIALLRELGIDSQPVIVSTQEGDGLDARLPMISLFDHVIVRAHIGSRDYWLDGTRSGDKQLAKLRAPAYRWGLPLASHGSELVAVWPEPLTEPESDTKILLDASAGIYAPAPFHVTTVLVGDSAILIKLRLAPLEQEALDRTLREYWSNKYDFVTIESTAARYDPEAATETLTMDGKAQMSWKDGWYETDGLGVGYDAKFERPAGASQTAPYAVAFPFYNRVSEKILLPPGQAFRIDGADVDQIVAGIEYRRHSSINVAEGTFTGEASSRSVQSEFPASEVSKAQDALRAMWKDVLDLHTPDRYADTDADLKAEVKHALASADEYTTRGNKLLNHQLLDLALDDFNKALALDHSADMALADRGFVYLYQHNPDRALEDWKAAEAINPRNPVVFRGRGVLAVQNKKYVDGIAALTKSIEIEPGNTFAHRWRAWAYWSTEDWKDAITDATAVLAAGPDLQTYYVRGTSYARSGQPDSAIADAQAVTKLDRARAPNYQAAGAIYIAAGKQAEAFEAYSQALKMEPDATTYVARAHSRPPSDLAGQMADANAALGLNPHLKDALVLRAYAAYRMGDYKQAAQSATDAIEADPGNIDARRVRARAYWVSEAWKDVIADSTAVIAAEPDPETYRLRGIAYARSGQLDSALGDAQAVAKLVPARVANYQVAAAIYFAAKKWAEAFDAYSQALKMEPDAATYVARARSRPRLDLAGQLADANAALGLEPHLNDALALRAYTAYWMGDYTKAAQFATDAMTDRPTSSLLIVRGAAYAKIGQADQSAADLKAAKELATTASALNSFCWNLATRDTALSDALAACDEALAKGPPIANHLDSRGFVLLRLGRNDDALAAYDEALQLEPKLGLSLYGRGIAKTRKGDVAGGRADMTAATAANPDAADLFELYGVKP